MPSAAPGTVPPPLRFGPSGRFELQAAERRLLVDGQPAVLGGRAFDLLLALAAQPDHLLTKNELLDRVWPGLVVEEANLQMQISNLRKLLGGDVIATVPGRGYRFVAAVQSVAAVPMAASAPVVLAAAAAAVSVAPRLFGRDADLQRLEALLHEHACVTLVGTPGVGKTSLARALTARWTGRSVWVDLAPLADEGQVAGTLARALGVQPGEGDRALQLLQAVRGAALLVVLDNAEHVIESCASLATLLAAAPQLRLLVTSQLPLAIPGETVQRLEPLSLSSTLSLELGDGALALLAERIAAADQRFRVTPEAIPLLAAICQQLDGLPLALEMAAARVPTLGLKGVHDALAERFALLTRGHRSAVTRHRTLHNALDWSYRLLGPAEQRLFRALGVFAGGFTVELAVALMTDDPGARWDVIDGLATLSDRSLVVVGEGDPPRYRLLESMRAFALEQLAHSENAADNEATWRRRHAGAMLALFEPDALGDSALAARQLAEMENAREAFTWARTHDLATAARLSRFVLHAVTFTVWRSEVTAWMRALEPDMEQATTVAPESQAAWWTHFARALSMSGDPRASAAARRAVSLWQPLQRPRDALVAAVVLLRAQEKPGPELDAACAQVRTLAAASAAALSKREQLRVHGALVHAARVRGDEEEVLAGRLREMELARELGQQSAVNAAESNVVHALLQLHRHGEAAQRARDLAARLGDDSTDGTLPYALVFLLQAVVRQGALDEARALAPRVFAACHRFGTLALLPAFVELLVASGRLQAAACLTGYTKECVRARSTTMAPDDVALLEKNGQTITATLGAAQFETLVAQGRALDEREVAALVSGAAP